MCILTRKVAISEEIVVMNATPFHPPIPLNQFLVDLSIWLDLINRPKIDWLFVHFCFFASRSLRSFLSLWISNISEPFGVSTVQSRRKVQGWGVNPSFVQKVYLLVVFTASYLSCILLQSPGFYNFICSDWLLLEEIQHYWSQFLSVFKFKISSVKNIYQ